MKKSRKKKKQESKENWSSKLNLKIHLRMFIINIINIINKTIEIEITTGDMISTHIIMTDIIIIEMIEADLEANNKTEMTEVGPEA